jgi:hypothetical protein
MACFTGLGRGGGRRPRKSQLCGRELVSAMRLRVLLSLIGAAPVDQHAKGFQRQQHQQAHPGTQLCVTRMIDLPLRWRWILLCFAFVCQKERELGLISVSLYLLETPKSICVAIRSFPCLTVSHLMCLFFRLNMAVFQNSTWPLFLPGTVPSC